MKVNFTVDYTDEEIDQMVGILDFLWKAADDAHEASSFPPHITKWIDDGFENIANLLCLDPQGEKIFHCKGW